MSKKVNSSIPSHLKYNKSLPNIPHYAKKYRDEYKFIKSIEKDLEYFIDNIDDINKGLFNSSKAKEINEKIRIFIRGQEIGRFKNLNGLEIKETDISNLIKIKKSLIVGKDVTMLVMVLIVMIVMKIVLMLMKLFILVLENFIIF